MQVLVPFKRNNFVLTSISCISLGHQLSNAITQESYILHSKKKTQLSFISRGPLSRWFASWRPIPNFSGINFSLMFIINLFGEGQKMEDLIVLHILHA